ncbi:C-8 sterol isomerase [Coprinopsis sp. MPI-PUGE-AT-0042]|nr:C-8 sterol isomerase [Coprinopsis sp. MPI-PUGE-AT-0042]
MSSKKSSKAQAPAEAQPLFNFSAYLMKWITRLTILGVIYATCSWLDTIKDRWYVFDPQSLHKLAQDAIAANPNNTAGMIEYITRNITETYPSSKIRINTDTSEWVFNNAGGAMGAMYVIHASITEYLIIFGTPLGTEGHSGLHTADDYFNILVGEQWAFSAGYPAGSVHHLPRGHVKQYKMHEGCFALEYARGWIPLMLPFGFADTISSTLDFPTFWKTTVVTAREMVGNLLIGKI